MFLPARKTDLIRAAVDLDERHRELWETRDARNKDQCDRPYPQKDRINNLMIAQGRVRRELNGKYTRYFVKDPDLWEQEAVDVREFPVPKGRSRCQFCGLDWETPRLKAPGTPQDGLKYKFVCCKPCGKALNLEMTYDHIEWDEKRNLKRYH